MIVRANAFCKRLCPKALQAGRHAAPPSRSVRCSQNAPDLLRRFSKNTECGHNMPETQERGFVNAAAAVTVYDNVPPFFSDAKS